MANKGIGATFRISTGEKYSVDRDGMINVKTKLGDTETEYKNLRLIGMNVLEIGRASCRDRVSSPV